jgi:hypothetical protein
VTPLLLAWISQAHASACCVGSTSSIPSRLGRCEAAAVGLMVSASESRLRYDGQGRVVDSSMGSQELSTVAFAGWRWSRWGQLGVSLPGQVAWRSTEVLEARGGGVGDLRLGAVLETPTERLGPSPVASLGLRLPTGRSWERASAPLGADITGRGGLGVSGTLGLERTSGPWPWTASASAELDYGQAWLLSPTVAVSLGRSLSPSWTVSTAWSHQRSVELPVTGSASRTRGAVQLVHGRQLAYRTWLSAGSDLPVGRVGRDRALEHSASLGYTRLF